MVKNSSEESPDNTKFLERHSTFRKFLKVALIVILILAGLNLASYLRHYFALDHGRLPEEYEVLSVELLIEDGGRLVWTPDGESLYYDKVDPDAEKIDNVEVYTIYRYDFDSGKSKKIISSEDSDAPPGNKGQPTISPNGYWLLFQGEYENHEASRIWCHPGKGKHNNLWVMNLNTSELYQLTDYGENEGVLHPHFSPDGTKICFSHLYSGEGWTGSWQIRIADFSIDGGTPSLENVKSIKPGAQEGEHTIFYETHDFSEDGETLLFTSDIDTGAMGLSEIYTYAMDSEKLVRLTHSWECHDEHANYSPDKKKIIWISKMQQQWALYRTDLLIMDADGDNKQMMVTSPGGIIADNDWAPSGDRIAFMNINFNQATNHDIYLVTLKGS